jgi:hypothetical protein
MLGSYTILEILLALAVFVLVAHELNGILKARREGLSKNLSRVVIRSCMLVLLVFYAVVAWRYLPLEGTGPLLEFGTPTTPWGYLVIGAMLTFLAALEAVSLVRARTKGLTTNVSRLVSHTVSFLVLLVMLGLAVRKWEGYMGRLELTYLPGIPVSAPLNPGVDPADEAPMAGEEVGPEEQDGGAPDAEVPEAEAQDAGSD